MSSPYRESDREDIRRTPFPWYGWAGGALFVCVCLFGFVNVRQLEAVGWQAGQVCEGGGAASR